MSGHLVLIGGGVRSGKSAFALRRALAAPAPRYFLATARPGDEEMRERIGRHQLERGDAFQTVEEPLELCSAMSALPEGATVVVDCLALWLSNRLLHDGDGAACLQEVTRLGRLARARGHCALLVTNEVGLGIVPDSALGRRFRDLAGHVHQRLSAEADELYFAVLGTLLRLRPGPVVALPPVSAG